MKVLTRGPAGRQDRHATELVHDEASARIVAFHLLPGQQVPPHRSDSTVLALVTSGSGRFVGVDSEAVLSVGEAVVWAPGELHSIESVGEPLRFLAIIAPRPGG